jgi:hypothetical protein
VVILEAILDNERQDLLEFFHGSAQHKEHQDACRHEECSFFVVV